MGWLWKERGRRESEVRAALDRLLLGTEFEVEEKEGSEERIIGFLSFVGRCAQPILNLCEDHGKI